LRINDVLSFYYLVANLDLYLLYELVTGGLVVTLDKLRPGSKAVIKSVECAEVSLRKHILDMGFTPGTEVTMIKAAPLGDPIEIRIRGYELTLRKADAAKIKLDEAHKVVGRSVEHTNEEKQFIERIQVEHPGLGEAYKNKKLKERISSGGKITFALVGNQNCGKTTLFNQLTGSNQHVGNFPGVTVDRKDGIVRSHPEATITDLPGIYSLSPYTAEEIVTRNFLLEQKPDCIINIVDASNIERNFYLTCQLMTMEIPMVIALNMMDEVKKNGGSIDVNLLESILGVPVVPISAAKNEGIDELVEHAVHVARYGIVPDKTIENYWELQGNGAINRCIRAVMSLVEDHALAAKISPHFAATKLIEGNDPILDKLRLDENEIDMVEHAVSQAEKEGGKDRLSALSDLRFRFISMICEKTVVYPSESLESQRSKKIDNILTGKYTALPAFVLIMALIFYLTFGPLGSWLSDMFAVGIDSFISLVDGALINYGINPVVHSLIIDGIFAGVGSVLSFMPVIVLLFFFLSLLEDSGYMARIAFVMDRLLRKIGLSGRSVVAMLMGFGCSVPAIMATRTLPSDRDRKMTILLTPFMSCSAKLPIYALFTAAFFPNNSALVMLGLYFGGIAVSILFALLLKRTAFKGEPVPFVMELPNYRMPMAKNVLQLIWEKAKDFLTKAFTVIFVASVVIWFLQMFDTRLNIVSDTSDSLLALIGGLIAPIFIPLGLGDWRISTALITGFTAKESVVSTLQVLVGGSDANLSILFTTATALVFLVFSLLYTPCVAAIAAVKRELGGKWSLLMVISQCVIAWIVSFIVSVFLRILGMM